MRYPRLKPDKTATFMHVYNRTAGSSAEFPFQAAEQEEFIRRLKKLSEYYVIFAVFDADSDKTGEERLMHESQNTTLLKLLGNEECGAMPDVDIWKPDHVVWSTNVSDTIKHDIGTEDWQVIRNKVREEHDFNVKGLNKNAMFIGYALAKAWEEGKTSPSLTKLCSAILEFAGGVSER